jgi:SAM-dependent methyltransferase
MSDAVGRDPQYEMFADAFAEHAADGLYNAHYDRPACLTLLGDVAGARVLDAACGPGLYAHELAARGATVVGFDQSPRMVDLSAVRVPSGTFRVHDLNDPLDWIESATIDLALLALAYEYLDEPVGALRELRRVLRPGGALVLSRSHPTADWLLHGGSYFERRVVDETWAKGWVVRHWLAPLEQVCAEVHDAGFLIERLVEPLPLDAGRSHDAEAFDRLQRTPGFLALRLVAR